MNTWPALPWRTARQVLLALLMVGAVIGLSGCADLGYYWQSASGHLQIMHATRPVADWVADPQTPAPLKARLLLTQRIRDFAISTLKLPDNPSYRSYADLHRSAAVWNVVAAPPYSLTLQTWCFPVVGCVGYRGYFDEAKANAEGAALTAQGLESDVYGVPAYSTLGWLNWAGGDPLLNTFIGYPEGELARLIFHELAHQVAYAPNDTVFNESFATAVERLGVQRWLATQASPEARARYDAYNQRRQQFRALTLATRQELATIYASNQAESQDIRAQAALKLRAMQRFHDAYAELKRGWGGDAGYDRWVAKANNASFAAQAAYDELVPGFEALFEQQGEDWPKFYDAVKRLVAQSPDERRQALGASQNPPQNPQKETPGDPHG